MKFRNLLKGAVAKVADKTINKVLPKTEVVEEPKKVEKEEPSYIGVVAPVVTPSDPWFVEPVKTEKVVAYEKQITETVEYKKSVEDKQLKKEPEDIHQKLYERASKYWGTWKEEIQSPGGSENFQSGPNGWNSGTGMGQFK